jgi:bZIP-type transcription factor MBZ1
MDIAERDHLLEAIRSELGSTQSENVALRQEIAALKKALLEGRDKASSITSIASSSTCKDEAKPLSNEDIPVLNLPPPGPLPPIGAAIAAAASREASPASVPSSSSFILPNTQKDVSSSLSQKNFWGGSSTSALGLFGMGGGVTPVHTVTSFPDFPSGILGQNVNAVNVGSPQLQENINPALNRAPAPAAADVTTPAPVFSSPVLEGLMHANGVNGTGFDGFADSNLFTLKMLDAYVYHLMHRTLY